MLRILYLFFFLTLSFLEAKPELLIFNGPSGCPWTEALAKEVLAQKEFSEALGEEVVLKIVDFSDEERRKQYGIEVFPTLLLLDEDSEKLAQLTYMPIGPLEYASSIKKILEFKNLLKRLTLSALDSDNLKELYLTAKHYDLKKDCTRILEVGAKIKEDLFFLNEQYAEELKTKKLKDPQVQKLRSKIIAKDPENKKGALFHLAVAEFEAKERRLKPLANPRTVVEPLIDYIKEYKDKDKRNVWRAEMMIAEYFFNKNKKEAALRHAECALSAAPAEKKEIVKEFIQSYSME